LRSPAAYTDNNNISKMKYGATVNHVFEVHDAAYYVRDTLYVRSGTSIEF